VRYIRVREDLCVGCQICALTCSAANNGVYSLELSRIKVVSFVDKEVAVPIVCNQCGLCAEACPSNAIILDESRGVYRVDEALCTECGVCTAVCPYGAIFLTQTKSAAQKCDLCGGEPACVTACPTDALSVCVAIKPFSREVSADDTRKYRARLIAKTLYEDIDDDY